MEEEKQEVAKDNKEKKTTTKKTNEDDEEIIYEDEEGSFSWFPIISVVGVGGLAWWMYMSKQNQAKVV